MTSIQDLLEKYQIKNGIENDQARIDEFLKDLESEMIKSLHFDPVPLEWYIPLRRVAIMFGKSVEKLIKDTGR